MTQQQSGDRGQTRGLITCLVCAPRMVVQRYLAVALGTVLVLAGVLKGQQLLADASVGRTSELPREVLIGAAAFELAFGCWLLAGVCRRQTRWLALAWFSILAVVALVQSVSGAASCACLGAWSTSPWLMFAFDVTAVGALWKCPLADRTPRWLFPAALCVSILPAAALLFVAAAPPPDQTLVAEIDLGDIVQGGRKQLDFHCRNNSGSAVEVVDMETSCPCARIQLVQNAIPTGEALAGNVTLDFQHEPDFVGNLAIEATGLNRDRQVAFTLVIRVRVHPASHEE